MITKDIALNIKIYLPDYHFIKDNMAVENWNASGEAKYCSVSHLFEWILLKCKSCNET